jgi:hypothetical protein
MFSSQEVIPTPPPALFVTFNPLGSRLRRPVRRRREEKRKREKRKARIDAELKIKRAQNGKWKMENPKCGAAYLRQR